MQCSSGKISSHALHEDSQKLQELKLFITLRKKPEQYLKCSERKRMNIHLPLQINRWLGTGILVTVEICSANSCIVGLPPAAQSCTLNLSLSVKYKAKQNFHSSIQAA